MQAEGSKGAGDYLTGGVTEVEAVFDECGMINKVPRYKAEFVKLQASCSEKDTLVYIALKESTFNKDAKNKDSSASGLYQFLTSSWNYYQCGDDIWNVEQQSNCAVKVMRKGLTYDTWMRWWNI